MFFSRKGAEGASLNQSLVKWIKQTGKVDDLLRKTGEQELQESNDLLFLLFSCL